MVISSSCGKQPDFIWTLAGQHVKDVASKRVNARQGAVDNGVSGDNSSLRRKQVSAMVSRGTGILQFYFQISRKQVPSVKSCQPRSDTISQPGSTLPRMTGHARPFLRALPEPRMQFYNPSPFSLVPYARMSSNKGRKNASEFSHRNEALS